MNNISKIKKIFLIVVLFYGVAFADTNTLYLNQLNENIHTTFDYKTINTDINNLLYNNPNLSRTKYGLSVYSTKLNKWIYTYNHKKLLVPASNTKLFTTFTSFYQLGQEYQISTKVYMEGQLNKGTLNGNLYIVGGGDPIFNINDLENIAAEIKKYGINKINGNIYGDGSFFDAETNRFKYSNDIDEVEAVAPITALSLEKNIVTVIVTAGTIPGKSVNVQFKPASSGFVSSVDAIVTANENYLDENNLYNNFYYEELNYKLYSGDSYNLVAAKNKKKNITKKTNKKSKLPSIRITTSMRQDGKQCFYVKGSLKRNKTYTYQYYIKDPVLITAYALKDRLGAVGINVFGCVDKKELIKNEIENKILIYTFKRNINDIIIPTNKFSDNYLAETLFKLNGAVSGNNINCVENSKLITKNILKKLNFLPDGFLLNDGSGLSRRNNITSELLTNILIYMYKNNFYDNLYASLSIAGNDGTLRKRMKNTAAENNLYAKTGTLSNVSSLAGYVNTKNGDKLIFSFIFNGPNIGAYKMIENKLGELLANY